MRTPGRPPSARPEVMSMEPYAVNGMEDLETRLHANEGRWAVPARVRKAVSKAAALAGRYPDPASTSLRAALGARLGVTPESIVTGAGADCLVDMLARAFAGPGRTVVDCPPTFEMYRRYSILSGASVVDAPRGADFEVDPCSIAEAVELNGAGLVFLCSPNNPDGSVTRREVVEGLLDLPALIVLDEAYIEFSRAGSLAAEAAASENLVVLRTFSKWAGLAGLRVGYAVAPPAVCDALWRVRPPYPVSSISEAAATAVLREAPVLEKLAARTVSERERLRERLGCIPFLGVLPGEGNFVLCEVRGMRASAAALELAGRGIAVRVFDAPGMEGFMRITVGTRRENDRLVCALRGMEAGHAAEEG